MGLRIANEIPPPMAVAVRDPRFVSTFPGSSDSLWMADVKTCRRGFACDVFEAVLFVESNGTAFILGMESEDGYSLDVHPNVAQTQQSFVQFLRDETLRDQNCLCGMAGLFSGNEYASEGKATAAYIAARNAVLVMGIGYHGREGKYELIGIDPNEGAWLEMARATLPFDELG